MLSAHIGYRGAPKQSPHLKSFEQGATGDGIKTTSVIGTLQTHSESREEHYASRHFLPHR